MCAFNCMRVCACPALEVFDGGAGASRWFHVLRPVSEQPQDEVYHDQPQEPPQRLLLFFLKKRFISF